MEGVFLRKTQPNEKLTSQTVSVPFVCFSSVPLLCNVSVNTQTNSYMREVVTLGWFQLNWTLLLFEFEIVLKLSWKLDGWSCLPVKVEVLTLRYAKTKLYVFVWRFSTFLYIYMPCKECLKWTFLKFIGTIFLAFKRG